MMRAADEGRSAFSKRGGGNRIGEKPRAVTIRSDPGHALAPLRSMAKMAASAEHRPFEKRRAARAPPALLGELAAMRAAAPEIPSPEGQGASADPCWSSAALITRFWYPAVDQRTLATGLTATACS